MNFNLELIDTNTLDFHFLLLISRYIYTDTDQTTRYQQSLQEFLTMIN